ncbi:MAG: plastocyanin/azurin family copper-binding protein [Hyphomicrobiales bacterium]
MRSSRSAVLAFGVLLGLACFGCNGSNKNPTAPGSGADVVVHITPNSQNAAFLAYSPDTVDVKVGQTVEWINDDNMAHTATETPTANFDTGQIAAGSSKTLTITGATGIRNYKCTINGHTMYGALNVTP